MNEMQVVAQSLGMGDDKSLAEMFQSQCSPAQIIQQNKELAMKSMFIYQE